MRRHGRAEAAKKADGQFKTALGFDRKDKRYKDPIAALQLEGATISILRGTFDFGCRDHPEQHTPARSPRSERLKKKDGPKIDPFTMHDTETFIATIHRDRGEAQGNYDEFRFFTGVRRSEQIAVVLSDINVVNGIISVNKAPVAGVEPCQSKTGE